MKMIIMMTMMTLSMLFTVTKHPLSMGLILMIQTLMTTLMVGMMIKSFWFSYMLFIIMLGGMLVLFMYMASIASNEKMEFSMKMTMFIITSIMIMMIMYMMSDTTTMEMELNYNNNILPNEQALTLNKMFSTQNSLMTIMMVTYLLLTMIIITNIVNVFEGPMRKKS